MVKEDFNEEAAELAYDLRQIYAEKILGESLIDVARFRKLNNYANYFNCLKDVWIVTRHKIIKKDSNAPARYLVLMNKAVETANKFPHSWLGKDKNPVACAAIELALNEVEMFLYEKIDEANLFGAKFDDEGL